MNVYKRAANFEAQLAAIKSQTVPVTEILVWENGEQTVGLHSELVQARSTANLGVWPRFAFALSAKAEITWVIDDDSIPGGRWLENALTTHSRTGGLVGSRGLRFRTTSSYTLYDEFGPNRPNEDIEEVDIVGHNWIFPTDWLGAFWGEYSNRFKHERAGEDIHLSYALQKILGVGTFTAPHPSRNRNLWGEQPAVEAEFGSEAGAISRSPESMRRFEEAYAHYIRLGFKPMCVRLDERRATLKDVTVAHALRRNPGAMQKIALRLGLRK